MKPLYLFLVVLLFCQIVTAQNRRVDLKTQKSRYNTGTLYAKLNLASLLDLATPTLQPGIEYRFNKRMAGELSVGIPIRAFSAIDKTDTTYFHYYKIRAELRFQREGQYFYLGPELLFTHKGQSKYDGWFRGNDGKDYEYDYAQSTKTIVAFGFKVGRIFPLSERWNFDGSISLGPRFAYFKVNGTNVVEMPPQRWLFTIADKQGASMGIHAAVGFKLSYQIK